MSIDAILTGQQKSYTKAEEDAFLAARANKKDFVYIESSASATNSYRVGEYFYWIDGSIYRAQENIASGATLISTPGGNCNRVGGNGALNSAQNSKAEKSDLTIINSTGSTATNSYKAGEYFYWRNSLCQAIVDISSSTVLAEGTNYIPTQGLICKLSTWDPTSGNTDVTVPQNWESSNQYFRQGNLLVVFFKVRPSANLQDGASIVLCSNVTSTFNISNVLSQSSMTTCVHHNSSSQGVGSDILLRVAYSSSNNTIIISNTSGTIANYAAKAIDGQLTLIVY